MLRYTTSAFRFGKNFGLSGVRPSLGASFSAAAPLQKLNKTEKYAERLQLLRDKMREANISVFIVPTDDPHMSEYTADYYNRREYISGFTGSAGVAVVTMDDAYLFTDGRYHQQAELELPKGWTLMKVGNKGVPISWQAMLTKKIFDDATLGLDPYLHSADSVLNMERLWGKNRVKLLKENPIDMIWKDNRPPKPCTPLRIHHIDYAGKTVSQKLSEVRAQMNYVGASSLVISSLDEIMWLFNIRGKDVLCNPVSICYAIVKEDSAHLFIDESKLGPNILEHLASYSVRVHPYETIIEFLATCSSKVMDRVPRVWFDSKVLNAAVAEVVSEQNRLDAESPIVLMKAIKNEAELNGMRQCHLRDGAAFVEFISALENDLKLKQNKSLTEVDIDLRLTASRASFAKFLDLSFPTIAGINENGAIVHYRASAESCKVLTDTDMLLLDSGGQYEDGTTDVTRTFHFGEPSPHQKQMYTRVLKGHMAIDRLVFPANTPGVLLDSHARIALWAVGQDYNHGTGHGVGAALNVHERPQSLSPRLSATQPLVANMIISNEPGYYEAGAFGVRIENLLIVVPKTDFPAKTTNPQKEFFGFEKLTFIPIQMKCIEASLLSAEEVRWLDEYHAQVREKLLPLLRTDLAKEWLIHATASLKSQQSAR
jgi:Xaa-Pro aminopeptidase